MQRILAPVPISFNEAIAIAVLGLAVNVVSAYLLREDHDHHHHDHHHSGHHGHDDSNLRAAGTLRTSHITGSDHRSLRERPSSSGG